MGFLDLVDILESMLDFRRLWRVYVGTALTFAAGIAIVGRLDSEAAAMRALIAVFIIGIAATLLWQRRSSRGE